MSRIRGRKRVLSEDDERLWTYVTLDVEPVRVKGRVHTHAAFDDAAFEDAMAGVLMSREPAAPSPAPSRLAKTTARVPKAPPPVPQARPAEPVRDVPLERRKARRLARGADEIDARLDLHGMIQDEAHSALDGFIRRCHASGLRTVLVITGKGGAGGRQDGDDSSYPQRERGVLKRMVPLWLDGAALRPLVISTSSAHVRHGGGGAIYVTLRGKG